MVQELNFQASSEYLPPQNVEAEESILGGILLDPEAIGRVADLIRPETFYLSAHQDIYQAALALHAQGSPTDLMCVTAWLQDHGLLAKVGGQNKLTQLVDRTVSAINVDRYAGLIKNKYLRRQLIKAANEVAQLAYESSVELEIVLDQSQQKIFSVTQDRVQQGLVPTEDILTHTFAELEQRSLGTVLPGLSCGFYDLDAMTQGFQRSDLIIIAGRPSMGKCLSHSCEIVLEDGSVTTIEEIYHSRQARLLTLKDWKFDFTQPSAFIDDGIKPVFRVTTQLGRSVESTITHPYLTTHGWRQLSQLKLGDKIAVPRKLEVFGTEILHECQVKLLAYLIGGDLTHGLPRFTNSNPLLQAEFAQAVAEFTRLEIPGSTQTLTPYVQLDSVTDQPRLGQLPTRAQKVAVQLSELLKVSPALMSHGSYCVPNQEVCPVGARLDSVAANGLTIRNSKNLLTLRLQELGLWGKDAHTKTAPAIVFRLQRPQIALFLNRLFAVDGWASVLTSGQVQLGYATVSEPLARQLQHLLLRFGILAALKFVQSKSRGHRWQLAITDPQSIDTFRSEIGIFGKEDALANLPLPESARDVYWDEIAAIESVGSKQVYDLTIPETHNFVANDICVHNTAIALQIARNIAGIHSLPIAVFSLEMSKEQLVQRLLANEVQIESNRLRSGRISQNEWEPLGHGISTLSQLAISIDDTPNPSMAEIRSKARQLQAERPGGLGMILLDYLQLMGADGSDDRVQELSKITRGLKGLARELNVPVVALSQLSRGVESRTNKRPMMSDLRESGALEQDADLIMMLYRDEYYHPDTPDRGVCEVLITKHRNGPVGTVKLLFEPQYTKFRNLANSGHR